MAHRQPDRQHLENASGSGRYAESAHEAWFTQNTSRDVVRSAARTAVLTAAGFLWGGPKRFVRCLYAHAVFPEQRTAFQDVIRWLKQHGEFIGSKEIRDIVQRGQPPDGGYYHLSFDDGFANVFEVGCDVLVREKVPASIFILPSFIDADADTLTTYFQRLRSYRKPLRMMTWSQVHDAVSAGFEIGSHTLTHARLSEVSGAPMQLHTELNDSKKRIEEATGVPCTAFAWPYGTMNDIDTAGFMAIKEAGYQIAFSAVRGRVTAATDVFCVPRHQVEFHWPTNHIRLWARGFRE